MLVHTAVFTGFNEIRITDDSQLMLKEISQFYINTR
jgi:hypothetical protein